MRLSCDDDDDDEKFVLFRLVEYPQFTLPRCCMHAAVEEERFHFVI